MISALKARARRNSRSVEEEACALLAAQLGVRTAVLREIKDSWQWQTRPVTAAEIETGFQRGRD
jgi:hypothetical protein